MLSDIQFAIAAGQIRETVALLDSQISRLRDTRAWEGHDAQRFFAEWDSEVRGRLLGAALKLDALVLVPFL